MHVLFCSEELSEFIGFSTYFHSNLITIQICEFTGFISVTLGAYEGKIQHLPFNFLLNQTVFNFELNSKYLARPDAKPSSCLNNAGKGPVHKYRCGLSIIYRL